MADRVLPSRDSFKRSGVTLTDAKPILAAYVREELKTEAEWREAIDGEWQVLHDALEREPRVIPELVELIRRVDAALEDV